MIVSCTLYAWPTRCQKTKKVHETIMFLLVTLPNIYRLKKISLHIFQIWLTITHLKYVGTQPCNLSLRACFTDINVSQDSVATYARCGGMLNIHITANLLWTLPVKKNVNRLRFDRIMIMSLWPRFFGPPCSFNESMSDQSNINCAF